MPPRGKIMRSTAAQITYLVDYMSTKRLFACGEFSGPLGAQRMEAEWGRLKSLLAEHGPDKSVDQWKHTWRDLKKKAREEAGRARQARNQTGNVIEVPSLTDQTKKILNTIGKECATGIGAEQETGVGVGSVDADPVARQASADSELEFQFQPIGAEIEILEAADVPEPPAPCRPRTPPPRPSCSASAGAPRPPGGASAGASGSAPRPPNGAHAIRRRTATQHSAAFVRAQNENNRILMDIAVELRMATRAIRRRGVGAIKFLKF